MLYLSLDPGVIGDMDERESTAKPVGIGQVMVGEGISEVIASDHADYLRGDLVLSSTGWRTHVGSDGAGLRKLGPVFTPITTALGVLGTPGFAAYSGITLIGKPKPGETVVVAAASGAVGSLVGQLAKMAGARVIGIADGLEQCRHVEGDLGFDAAIDGRTPGFADMLIRACPERIDVYFDNIRCGPRWHAVQPLLNRFARVLGATELPHPPMDTLRDLLDKSLTPRGLLHEKFADSCYPEFLRSIAPMIADGRVRYREDITHGLENTPRAFIELLEGRKLGNALVRVAP